VNSPNNILVIGMTNRLDMIDEALTRPGRLEVHVEIGLPDEEGRVQIFNIHTAKMKQNGFLGDDVDLQKLAALTPCYTGAEIEGVVKNANSYALYGSLDVTQENGGVSNAMKVDASKIKIEMADFEYAIAEAEPKFGTADGDLKKLCRGGVIDWGKPHNKVMNTCLTLRDQVLNPNTSTPLKTILLEGRVGCGKTAIAASLGVDTDFPFVKCISPENFVNKSEFEKCDIIQKVFVDAYKTPHALIILDNIERLLEYVPLGQRFSNHVLQTILVLLTRIPTNEDCNLLVIGTTQSTPAVLESMQLRTAFQVPLEVQCLTKVEQVVRVLKSIGVEGSAAELNDLAQACTLPIAIKDLLMVTEMARQGVDQVTPTRLADFCIDCGLHSKHDY
jgi:vesicle-fusing ATPase